MISKASHVLIVEDEPLVRMSLVEDLQDAGFRVLEAGNADDALRLLDGHPEIDALFTDIDMPGSIDGLHLTKIVLNSRPEVAILLTSGYLKVPKGDLPEQIPFLSKPYDVGRVINHIRQQKAHSGRTDCVGAVFRP
jgi:two-component system, response regulator PdtaR